MIVKAVWCYSGHYRPTEEHFMEFISFLEEQQVDLTNVKVITLKPRLVLLMKPFIFYFLCNSH